MVPWFEYAAKKDGTRGEVTEGGDVGIWETGGLTKEPSRFGVYWIALSRARAPASSLTSPN